MSFFNKSEKRFPGQYLNYIARSDIVLSNQLFNYFIKPDDHIDFQPVYLPFQL